MRSILYAFAVATLSGVALAQPVRPMTGAGSLNPGPANGTLNVPAFITGPSATNPAPAYAPSPTTPIPQGQFMPAPPPTLPQIGILPSQVPPSILERSRPMAGSH